MSQRMGLVNALRSAGRPQVHPLNKDFEVLPLINSAVFSLKTVSSMIRIFFLIKLNYQCYCYYLRE
jgi:hypothetical protein